MRGALTSAPKSRLFVPQSWKNEVPSEPGVYAIRDVKSSNPVYVGESSNLRSRMGDLGRTVNHTFRRKAAAILKMNAVNDVALTEAMSRRYEISFIKVQLGRAELEEFLVIVWRETPAEGGPGPDRIRGLTRGSDSD